MEKGETMKTFLGVLVFALLVVSYQLTCVQDELQDKTEAMAELQQLNSECHAAIDVQNIEIKRHAILLNEKNALLTQSANRQVELVLKQPQVSSKDAAELNTWLKQNFTVVANE